MITAYYDVTYNIRQGSPPISKIGLAGLAVSEYHYKTDGRVRFII